MFMMVKTNDNSGGRNYVSPKAFPLSLNVEGIMCASVKMVHESFTIQDDPVFGWE